MALSGEVGDIVDMVKGALGLCARNSALVERDRVSFIGDVTDILWDCFRILTKLGFSQVISKRKSWDGRFCHVGLSFARIFNRLGASALLGRCFHLYTTQSNLTMVSLKLKTLSTMSQSMEFLEGAFRLVFPEQNVMILVVERDSGNIKASEISSTALQHVLPSRWSLR